MIIAITGLAGSGKNTVADMITGVPMAFADPMKKFCQQIFGFTNEELFGPSEARERPSKRFCRPNGEPLTPRFALQTLGTEWGRNCDPDVWVKYAMWRAREIEATANQNGAGPVIITDLRFVNEAEHVLAAGGEIWRIDRPGLTRGSHPSEIDIWSPAMDRLVAVNISNTGTLEQLKATVKRELQALIDG